MEAPNQEKIVGRLCAMGRAKYTAVLAEKPGYVFTKNGFAWELDQLDLEKYGITLDALVDCIDQLEKMGTLEDLKGSEHIRDGQGWMNTGLVITSKLDPRITCAVTLVSQNYEDADVNLRWYADIEGQSVAARGPAERTVGGEELKVVERAQAMAKETKKEESIDSLFENPLKHIYESSKPAAKSLDESTDFWGLPMVEEFAHVGVDPLEEPESEIGKNKEEVDAEGKVVIKTNEVGKTPEHVDGKGQEKVGEVDIEKELAAVAIKPITPDAKLQHVGEADLNHVGIEALAKPKSEIGDKDREEVDGKNVDVKPGEPDSNPEHMAGKGGEVGTSDKLHDVPASAVKPVEPGKEPKLMAEREKLKEMRKKQYESYMAKKKAIAEEKKKRIEAVVVAEDVQHPVKALESLKKNVEEAHRTIKKAHHLTEWAHAKVSESHKHLPSPIAEAIKAHEGRMAMAKQNLHEAKMHMHEVCEEIAKHHAGMKKK